MTVTLDTLELTPEELAACKEAVKRLAYINWRNAACPEGRDLDFWLSAEREWIEHCYVPDRPCDGKRPDGEPTETAPDKDRRGGATS